MIRDRQFGPPSVGGGGGGGVSHKCRKCEVWWSQEGESGRLCWMCGEPGIPEVRYFAGYSARFIDEPPMWYLAEEKVRQARIAKAREGAA